MITRRLRSHAGAQRSLLHQQECAHARAFFGRPVLSEGRSNFAQCCTPALFPFSRLQVGVGCLDDGAKIKADLGITVRGCVELGASVPYLIIKAIKAC